MLLGSPNNRHFEILIQIPRSPLDLESWSAQLLPNFINTYHFPVFHLSCKFLHIKQKLQHRVTELSKSKNGYLSFVQREKIPLRIRTHCSLRLRHSPPLHQLHPQPSLPLLRSQSLTTATSTPLSSSILKPNRITRQKSCRFRSKNRRRKYNLDALSGSAVRRLHTLSGQFQGDQGIEVEAAYGAPRAALPEAEPEVSGSTPQRLQGEGSVA